MDIRRWILAIILPPSAVTNKEAGTIMLTGLLTLFGWLPGVVFAIFMMLQEKTPGKRLISSHEAAGCNRFLGTCRESYC